MEVIEACNQFYFCLHASINSLVKAEQCHLHYMIALSNGLLHSAVERHLV